MLQRRDEIVFVQDFNQNGLLFYNSFIVLGPMILLALFTEDLNKVDDLLFKLSYFLWKNNLGLEL